MHGQPHIRFKNNDIYTNKVIYSIKACSIESKVKKQTNKRDRHRQSLGWKKSWKSDILAK
jgi:hypothetical protein